MEKKAKALIIRWKLPIFGQPASQPREKQAVYGTFGFLSCSFECFCGMQVQDEEKNSTLATIGRGAAWLSWCPGEEAEEALHDRKTAATSTPIETSNQNITLNVYTHTFIVDCRQKKAV
jgi:superoxide dismutase